MEIIEAIKQGKIKKAEHMLLNNLAASPQNVEFLILLSVVLWYRFKGKEALVYANKARDLFSNDLLLLYTYGRILQYLEDYQSSLTVWNKIIEEKEYSVNRKFEEIKSERSILNDSLFGRADCLYHLFRDKEACSSVKEHLENRRRGLQSDFTKKQVIIIYKILKYSGNKYDGDTSMIGYATKKQSDRIQKRLDVLEKKRNKNELINYLESICELYPNEYYYKTVLSELFMKTDCHEDCLRYAKEAYNQMQSDPLVKYDYAVALMVNGLIDEATKQFQDIVEWGIDYIAYSEHGEGLRWAKKIMRLTKKHLLELTQ